MTSGRASIAASLLLAAMSLSCRSTEVVPLTRAFAHNDYQHARPLHEALDCGFCAVEADVHLVDRQLLVAHDRDQVRADRTLQLLYLDPLKQRVRENGGRVYRNGPTVALFIDFKTPAAQMYPALRRVLEQYEPMLTTWRDGVMREGAVRVVLTGDRPSVRDVGAEPIRLVALDGQMSANLDSDAPPAVMPDLSGEWKTMFHWDGHGTMPADQREVLRQLVQRVHAKGRRLRLWGAPDTPATWKELLAAGVDRINSDDLPGLRDFLLRNP